MNTAVKRGVFPGAVLLVRDRDRVFYLRAFGHRSLEPQPSPMQEGTIFDLSSLTKPLATSLAVMLLDVLHGFKEVLRPQLRLIPSSPAVNADAYEHVAGLHEAHQLFGIEVIETVIIGEGAYERNIIVQAVSYKTPLSLYDSLLRQVAGEVGGR